MPDDVTAYLNGSITLNDLIERNDDAIDALPDEDKGGPLWSVLSDIESLVCERVYEYIDEGRFRVRLADAIAQPVS